MTTETPNENRTVHWNDPKILTAAGTSPEAVRSLLTKHNQGDPSPYAVYQWTSRRKIPDAWRVKLAYCLLRENKITLADMFRIGTARRTHYTRGHLKGQPIANGA